jgi:hypothetical protein
VVARRARELELARARPHAGPPPLLRAAARGTRSRGRRWKRSWSGQASPDASTLGVFRSIHFVVARDDFGNIASNISNLESGISSSGGIESADQSRIPWFDVLEIRDSRFLIFDFTISEILRLRHPSYSGKPRLATGGGAVLREANRRHLRERGLVVYLKSSPDELFRRLRHDRNRPLLQVADPLVRLRDLYAIRDPLYRETAHFSIETGRPSVATLVNMIVMQLELAGAWPPG